MFSRLMVLAKKPRKPVPIRALLVFLKVQAALQLIILVVVTWWPERAFALSSLVFLGFGLTVGLWLDLREVGVEQTLPTQSS